jgi:hypothetical protein
MSEETQERRLQGAARRLGLKMVLDRYSACATGHRRYFVRPIWDEARWAGFARWRLRAGNDHGRAEDGSEPPADR